MLKINFKTILKIINKQNKKSFLGENDVKWRTTHLHSWQRSPVGITPPSGKSWPFTPQPTRHARTNTHRVTAVHWTHTQWTKETHLDKRDSRYWGEEQLGFYTGGYTAPSHSERDPPGERRERYQCRWRWQKRRNVYISQHRTHQTVADVTGVLFWAPLGSVVILDTRVDTTCKHIWHQWLNVNCIGFSSVFGCIAKAVFFMCQRSCAFGRRMTMLSFMKVQIFIVISHCYKEVSLNDEILPLPSTLNAILQPNMRYESEKIYKNTRK